MDQILLIEDDSTIAAGIAYSLEQEGWKVTSIGTLAQGKEALETGRFTISSLRAWNCVPGNTGYSAV